MPRVKQFNEEEVLERAMELFWKQGYNGTSMQELVDHLGINRASLYNTFGDKKALFDRAFAQYRANSQNNVKACLKPGQSLRENLLAMYTMVVDGALGDGEAKGCFVVNATAELHPENTCLKDRLAEHKRGMEARLLELLKAGAENGEIPLTKDL